MPSGVVYTVLGGLGAVENILPVLPADTAIGAGVFLSHYGTVSAFAVFAVVWTANVGSAAAVYAAARRFGRPFFQGRIGQKLLAPKAMAVLEMLYERHGVWGIFASRFVPGVRAVIPPFAGVAGLGTWQALLPVALASALWYGLLTILVVQLAGTIEEMVHLVDRMNRGVLIGAGIAIGMAVIAIIAWRRRRAHE